MSTAPRKTTLPTMLAVAAVALAQTAVLAYMVIDRIQLLRTGREIVLPIVPIDPRDFFRGEFIRLDYPAGQFALAPDDGVPLKRNETVYVTLEKPAQGDDWRPIAVSRTFKREGGPDRIVLKAWSLWDAPLYDRWRGAAVRYGIESYFVRQGDGPKLEALARDRKLAVLVAVDRHGTAAVKGLIIDGKLQYEEPLL